MNVITSPLAWVCLAIFIIAYACVIGEEVIHMKKSKPVMLAAGLIWIIIGIIAATEETKPEWISNQKHSTEHIEQTVNASDSHKDKNHDSNLVKQTATSNLKNKTSPVDTLVDKHHKSDKELLKINYKSKIFILLEEYADLFFFLLVAMSFILTLEERGFFNMLRGKLVSGGFSFRQIFWITGILSFFLSPIADNLTTAMVMGTICLAVGGDNKKFITPAFVNIVVAANSGGAFSPFGDITTLMVWQAEKIEFLEFFSLFFPAVVNFIIPAVLLHFFIPKGKPEALTEKIEMHYGAKTVATIFVITIALSITCRQLLGMPPFLGMMSGLSILLMYTYFINKMKNHGPDINVFKYIERTEFDTLFFFFGIIFCIGGLSYLGFLDQLAGVMYNGDPTSANIVAGALSAVIDNIPMMFGVLTMNPDMSHYQWLMITLTCGVGGSMLALGSAAGVGLMGLGRGQYTFTSHLKYSWAVALGYFASIACHYLINSPK